MLEKMSEMIAEQLNCDAAGITAETSFKDDLGADSLDLFELVMALEDEYNIEIPAEDLTDLTTVGAVMDAFVFPGQGAQYTGMAKDFYEKYAVSREVFESASKASGLDVKALCFEENDRLNITEYTQIAMLTAEIAILRAVEEAGIRSQVNAGLSLGEYGALVASGVMKEEDAFTVVRKRGIFMQEAYPTGGAMSAVLGTDAELIEKIPSSSQIIEKIMSFCASGTNPSFCTLFPIPRPKSPPEPIA